MDEDTSTYFLRQYELFIEKTDKFSKDEITPILMGLYGEVGSIMATSKKYYREKRHMLAIEPPSKKNLAMLSGICRLCVVG